ncbi:MAG: valine--pyruvate aminotransferase [Pseudomonadota bacterium]
MAPTAAARSFSSFGQRYTGRSGIVALMEDLGSALRANPQMIMMGGGTPARIPAVEQVFRNHLQAIAADSERAYAMLGRYQGPRGDSDVRECIAALLRREYGWAVSAANIAVTNGGQSAFSILANMLAGAHADGTPRVIRFPLVPEYIGYTDVGVSEPFFRSSKPLIEQLPDKLFKYRVDFAQLQIEDDVAALCVSRPTNPSGNMLGADELLRLDAMARARGIPLIIDAAYGAPFPGIEFDAPEAYWSDNVILMLSLSKLGLPGLRSGFLVASEAFVQAFATANTILNLASGNVGPTLLTSLLRSGELLPLCRTQIQPWYRDRLALALDCLRAALGELPFSIHRAEGAFFLWLWFRDLPGGSTRLYTELKAAGVLVIPGDTCFPGLSADWDHAHQCVRLSYAVDAERLRAAATIIGRVAHALYA